mgnify:CR=1 FL=1
MEQRDFLKKDELRTPKEEIDVRLVLEQYHAAMTEISVLREENTELKEQLAKLKKYVYGQKSEKTEVVLEGAEQIPMFDEAEQESDINPKTLQTTEVKAHKRVKRTRDELNPDLPVEEVFHEVEDKTCDKCGSEMTVIGKEKIRDELVYVPARLFLRRHVAEVVKCPVCGMDETKDEAVWCDIEKCNIRTAEVPSPMIPHSFVSPELLAHIVYEKYCNAMPLYRLEKDFAAKGANISRTTMANWIITASQLWVKPVWEQMHKELVTSSVIHADETVVQVLNEPGKKAKTDSRMWVYCNGKMNDHSNILFEYQPTRNGDHASKFLGDYHGYVVCDGYDGYNKLKNAVRCGCWAHVRRKFVDALPADKELLSTSAAAKGVEYCNRLFLLERKYNGEDEKGNRIAEPLTAEQRYPERQKHSKAVLDEFFAWAEGLTVSGGTKLAKAVSYAKSEKKYLYRFLESGEIPIDNNRAENAVRPFCVGRKNWLFSASVKGAEASAMMYSVAATACANGMNVEQYLTELFRGEAGTVVLPW